MNPLYFKSLILEPLPVEIMICFFFQLIKQLMLAVKAMQQELVDTRSKSSNKKEFYAKNSSWTEGLISGGKSLGLSANMLVFVSKTLLTN